jgi:hypothetical protein
VSYYGAGTRAVATAAPPAGTPAWIVTHGWETGVGMSPGGTSGRDIIVDEMLAVASVAGSVFQLQTPTTQHHVTVNGPGAVGDELLYVRAVRPALDVEIADLTLDARTEVVACGVYATRAARLSLRRVGAMRMTRMAFEHAEGCRDGSARDVYWGACNGGVAYLSSNNCDLSGARTEPTGARFREVGVIRSGLWLYRSATEIKIADCEIRHMCQGVWFNAIRDCTFNDSLITDLDIREKFVRDGLDGGVGIHMGAVELSETMWSYGLVMRGIELRNLRSEPPVGPPRFFAIYYHDVYGVVAGGVGVFNDGLGSDAVVDGDGDYYMGGVGFQDSSGQYTDHTIKGCQYALTWRSGQGCDLRDWNIDMIPGGGPPATNAIHFQSINLSTLSIRGLRLQGQITFAPGFAIDEVQNVIDVQDVYIDGISFSFPQLALAINGSGGVRAVGDVLTLDPAPASGVRTAILGADNDPPVVVVTTFTSTIAAGAPMFIAAAGDYCGRALVSGPVQFRQKLRLSGAGPWLVADDTAPADVVFGRALSAKPGAALGPVRTSP